MRYLLCYEIGILGAKGMATGHCFSSMDPPKERLRHLGGRHYAVDGYDAPIKGE